MALLIDVIFSFHHLFAEMNQTESDFAILFAMNVSVIPKHLHYIFGQKHHPSSISIPAFIYSHTEPTLSYKMDGSHFKCSTSDRQRETKLLHSHASRSRKWKRPITSVRSISLTII